MSTRIYNGLQIHGLTTVRELRDWTQELREDCTRKALDNISDTILRKSCYIYDALTVQQFSSAINVSTPVIAMGMNDGDNCLHYIISSVFKSIREQSKSLYRNPNLDYDFDLSILPIENKTLAMGFYEQSFYKKILMNEHNNVSDYGYWNNSDKPDDVSEKEWKERERDWNLALPKNSTPSENGMQVSVVHSDKLLILFDKDKHLQDECLPTLEERANSIADYVHRELSIKYFCREEGLDLQDLTSSQFIDICHKADKDTKGKNDLYGAILKDIDEDMTIEKLMKTKADLVPSDKMILGL